MAGAARAPELPQTTPDPATADTAEGGEDSSPPCTEGSKGSLWVTPEELECEPGRGFLEAEFLTALTHQAANAFGLSKQPSEIKEQA